MVSSLDMFSYTAVLEMDGKRDCRQILDPKKIGLNPTGKWVWLWAGIHKIQGSSQHNDAGQAPSISFLMLSSWDMFNYTVVLLTGLQCSISTISVIQEYLETHCWGHGSGGEIGLPAHPGSQIFLGLTPQCSEYGSELAFRRHWV